MRNIKLLFLILAFSVNAYCQDTPWIKKQVNEFLTLNLPRNFKYDEQDLIKSYAGYNKDGYFAISYYDSAMKVTGAENFKTSLADFAHKISNRMVKEQYKITLIDTSIGNTKGIMIISLPNERADYPNKLFTYVTMANDHFYSFIATNATGVDEKAVRQFFEMIEFDANKIKETKY